jgi:hypothetical protein
LKDEFDEIVAAECVYCGDMMINTVAEGLVDSRDKFEIASWAI